MLTPNLDSRPLHVCLIMCLKHFAFLDTWRKDEEQKRCGKIQRAFKVPSRTQSVNAHSYMVVVHWSTQMPFTCVCECMYCICVYIYWGVTWALWECSGCQKLIYNAGLSLSRLLRVQGKERMLSQVSNKSVPSTVETIELFEKGPVL